MVEMNDACVVCGYQGDEREFIGPTDDETGRRCRLCDSFEDLRADLAQR